MPTLVKEAGLAKKNLTNHCIRSTCITILDSEGYEARHIMEISGHKKEESIKSCASVTSRNTKRKISETLGNVMAPSPPPAKKFTPPTAENQYLHTSAKCNEKFEGNKRNDDPDPPANFNLGLADLLELNPEEEQSLLKELMSNEIPIPPGPNELSAPAVPSTQPTQCNTVNTWNPLQQMQQIMPKMVF